MISTMAFRHIDIKAIESEANEEARAKLLKDLVETINVRGAAVIHNVGIDAELVRQAFSWVETTDHNLLIPWNTG